MEQGYLAILPLRKTLPDHTGKGYITLSPIGINRNMESTIMRRIKNATTIDLIRQREKMQKELDSAQGVIGKIIGLGAIIAYAKIIADLARYIQKINAEIESRS